MFSQVFRLKSSVQFNQVCYMHVVSEAITYNCSKCMDFEFIGHCSHINWQDMVKEKNYNKIPNIFDGKGFESG